MTEENGKMGNLGAAKTRPVSADELRKMQQKSWEIYQYFADFCDQRGLRFYGCGGCVIGVARDGKFIPWDDDVDVYMPRPDYERLASLWNREADTERFSYVRTGANTHTGDVMAKICDNFTTLVTPYQIDKKIPQGLTIDIFPLDGAPQPKSLAWWWQMLMGLIFNLYNVAEVPKNHGKVVALIAKVALALVPHPRWRYKLWRTCEKQMSKWDYDSHEWSATICDGPKEMFTPFQRKWFGRGIDMPLEVAETQQQYRVPDDYDTYLRAEYGDGYLTPPPADEQQPKHAVYFMDLDTPCHKYMTNGRFDPRKAGMSY
ncbi:phosphorylcholine transferase LicD [Varibaculum massiliense]|uniref:LicD family protein n=1 Tax=Varibaculum massiliense TaxID=1852372 RepID=UPI0025926043|nr:LicD family protein [Varibaculum massiliense]